MGRAATPTDLVCLIVPGVREHDRAGVKALLAEMEKNIRVRCVETRGMMPGYFKKPSPRGQAYWIVAGNWRYATRLLAAKSCPKTLFVSILDTSTRRTLREIITQKFTTWQPSRTHFVTHNPINFRFLREMARVPKQHVHYLPFPYEISKEGTPTDRERIPVVGTFASLRSESNLHYFLNVAHFVVKRGHRVQFKILGRGELKKHLQESISALTLENHVQVVDTDSIESLAEVDIYVHVSLQSPHFLPILAAAQLKTPVLASDVPGISDMVQDGKTGFVVPVNDTKPMGELIVRMLVEKDFRREMGEKLHQVLAEDFSMPKMAAMYQALFLKGRVLPPQQDVVPSARAV